MVFATTWTYIVISWLTTLLTFGLVIALLNNFLRKKTTGTLVLFASYLIIGISAAIGALTYTLQPFIANQDLPDVLTAISTVLPQIALLLIYIFSCRHILKDNEVVKALHVMVFSLLLGFIFTAYIFGIFDWVIQDPEAWYYIDTTYPTGESPVELRNISIRLVSFILIGIQLYINARIFIRAFVLSRRTDKIIRKRGLLMIGWGLVIYLTAGFIIGIEFQVNNQAGILILWILRKIVFIISYVFLYLGWIMPDWFRRNIRDKTWFEMRYKEVSKIVSK